MASSIAFLREKSLHQAGEPPLNIAAALSVPGLDLRASRDIAGVQWGKLIINLNNALSALSDMPLAAQFT